MFLAFWLASSFTMEHCEGRLAPDSCSLDDRCLMPSAPSSLSYMQSSSPSVKMMDRLNTLTSRLDRRTSESVTGWLFLTLWFVRYLARLVTVTGNVRRNFSGQRRPGLTPDLCYPQVSVLTSAWTQATALGICIGRCRLWAACLAWSGDGVVATVSDVSITLTHLSLTRRSSTLPHAREMWKG